VEKPRLADHTWDDMIEVLKEYWEHEGHCRVPQLYRRTKDSANLGGGSNGNDKMAGNLY
jgi:hypothetical protein